MAQSRLNKQEEYKSLKKKVTFQLPESNLQKPYNQLAFKISQNISEIYNENLLGFQVAAIEIADTCEEKEEELNEADISTLIEDTVQELKNKNLELLLEVMANIVNPLELSSKQFKEAISKIGLAILQKNNIYVNYKNESYPDPSLLDNSFFTTFEPLIFSAFLAKEIEQYIKANQLENDYNQFLKYEKMKTKTKVIIDMPTKAAGILNKAGVFANEGQGGEPDDDQIPSMKP